MLTPQFLKVGTTDGKYLLADAKPVGVDAAYNVTIQILNDDGTTDFAKSYTWDGSIWVNDQTNADSSSVPLTAGTGLWTYSNSDEPTTFQTSGQVSESDVTFPLSPWGAVGIGNPFPVTRTLGQIAPVGDDTAYNVTIQILRDDGSTDFSRSYTWNGTSWINDQTNVDSGSVEIGAGVGMWVYSNSDEDASLYIPAPTL